MPEEGALLSKVPTTENPAALFCREVFQGQDRIAQIQKAALVKNIAIAALSELGPSLATEAPIYQSVSAGLAASSEEEYFSVIPGSTDLVSFIIYRKLGGVAVEQTRISSSTLVDTLQARVDALELGTAALAGGGPAEDLVGDARDRAGDARSLFSSATTGAAKSRQPITAGIIAVNAEAGSVLRVRGHETDDTTGYVDVAARVDFAVEPGRLYLLRYVFARHVNPTDPRQNAVEARIQNLNQNKNNVSVALLGSYAPTVDNGVLRQSFLIGKADAPGSRDYTVPPSAVYAVPFLRIYGNGQETDIVSVSIEDVTQHAVGGSDTAALIERVQEAEEQSASTAVAVASKADVVQAVFASPAVLGPESWAIAKWFNMYGDVPLDAFDKPGSRVAPGVDSTDGMYRAFNSGYSIIPPLRGGDYTVSDTIPWELRRTRFAGMGRRFNFGSEAIEIERRSYSIKLTATGAFGARRPLFRILEEGCYAADLMLRGEGPNGYQTAIFASKAFAPGFTGGGAIDFAFDNVRVNGFDTAFETIGWGVHGEGNRSGDCRNFMRFGFPDPGTFSDPGTGGQSILQAFRQFKMLDSHMHATTRGYVNIGSQRAMLNGAKISGVVADTGCQVFLGVMRGIMSDIASYNGSNVTDLEETDKTSLLRFESGSDVQLVNAYLAGLMNDGHARLPNYLIQLVGDVSFRGSAIHLRNCQRSAIQCVSSGHKEIDIDLLKIANAHQDNDFAPSRLLGPIDVAGGTVDMRLGKPTFESDPRLAYAPIVTVDTPGGVSAGGVRVEMQPAPRYPSNRFTGLAIPGVRINTRKERDVVRLKYASGATVVAPLDTVENVLATINIDGGEVGPNGHVLIKFAFSHTNSANDKTMRVRGTGLGGPLILSQVATTTASTKQEGSFWNTGSEATQRFIRIGYGSTTVASDTSTIDTSAAWQLVITGQKAVGAEDLTLRSCTVEIIYGA